MITVYLSLTFAYLATAYFIGKNLSRMQAATVNTIFLLFACITAWGTAAYTNAGTQTLVRAGADLDGFYSPKPWVATLVGVGAMVGVIMCLKFMWDVRHSE